MSVVINTNSSATLASMNLASSNANLSRSLNRLSSGSRIVTPADDAGGLAVSMKQSAATRRLSAINNNLGNTLSFLQTQDGVLKVAGKVLDRISELKTLSVDPTKNASDLANYDVEFKALQQQLTSLGGEKFNGVSLFGTTTMAVQVADDPSQTMSIAGIDLLASTAGTPVTINLAANTTVAPFAPSGAGTLSSSHTLYFTGSGGWGNVIGTLLPGSSASYDGAGNWSGLSTGSVSGTSVNLDDDALGGTATFTPASTSAANTGMVAAAASLSSLSLGTVTGAIADVASHRAKNGASQSRIQFAMELQTVNKTNLESSVSRIVDVDVASESTQLARWNTLVQAGTAMLSQANQSTQSVMRLLQG